MEPDRSQMDLERARKILRSMVKRSRDRHPKNLDFHWLTLEQEKALTFFAEATRQREIPGDEDEAEF